MGTIGYPFAQCAGTDFAVRVYTPRISAIVGQASIAIDLLGWYPKAIILKPAVTYVLPVLFAGNVILVGWTDFTPVTTKTDAFFH